MVHTVTLALNEPLTVNPLDEPAPATGSLLGSLVICARHRGIQLSKEQLIRDHQLKSGDASPGELPAVARASGLRERRRAARRARRRRSLAGDRGSAAPSTAGYRDGARR